MNPAASEQGTGCSRQRTPVAENISWLVLPVAVAIVTENTPISREVLGIIQKLWAAQGFSASCISSNLFSEFGILTG
jgi:hypothetical protein